MNLIRYVGAVRLLLVAAALLVVSSSNTLWGQTPNLGFEPIDVGASKNWRLFGGAEALFLRADFASNPAFFTNSTATDFDFGFSASPRVWFGVECMNGGGIFGRWFRFSDSANTQGSGNSTSATGNPLNVALRTLPTSFGPNFRTGQPNVTGNTSDMQVVSSLSINNWDLPLSYALERNGWQIKGEFGVRYTDILQIYRASSNSVISGTQDYSFMGNTTATPFQQSSISSDDSRQSFQGFGPLLGLEITRRLGNPNWGIFGGVRGAVVYGESTLNQSFNSSGQLVVGTPNVGVTSNFNSSTGSVQRDWKVVSVLELDLGVLWSRPVGNGIIFVRPALNSQSYFNAGRATAFDGDFHLLGASITVGWNY